MKELIFGAATGILFGFFLQKARVLRYEKQVGFLRLLDMTIIKFMLSAVAVGMIGIYALKELGQIQLSPKPVHLACQIVGGLLFGVGWGICGFCPGTSVGAVGEGRVHALPVVVGMLAGAAAYAEVYPLVSKTLLKWGSFGKLTMPELFSVSPWVIIGIFVVIVLILFALFEKLKV